MFPLAIMIVAFAPVPAEKPGIEQALLGKWWFNGGSNVTELEVTTAKDSKLEGTLYDAPCTGSYDATTHQVTLTRKAKIDKATTFTDVQEFSGTLTLEEGSKPAKYKLEGKFKSLAGPKWGSEGFDTGWIASAVRLQSPAADLKDMQGKWDVARIMGSDANHSLPAEAQLIEGSKGLTIRGNELMRDGKTVATLGNDLRSASLQAEIGFKDFRLMMLTLPDGKAYLCQYQVRKDSVEIIYPHTKACSRSAGQTITLNRPAQ